MNEAATIRFRDVGDSDEALAIVRYDEKQVAICFSKRSDGEMEVLMSKVDARALVEALQKAVS